MSDTWRWGKTGQHRMDRTEQQERTRQLGLPVSGQARSLREQLGCVAVLASEEMRSKGRASGPPHLCLPPLDPHPTPRKCPLALLSRSHLPALSPLLHKHCLHLFVGRPGRGVGDWWGGDLCVLSRTCCWAEWVRKGFAQEAKQGSWPATWADGRLLSQVVTWAW